MPWVGLDDLFMSNPKRLRAGPEATLLFLAALCYSNNQLTDGRIGQEMLPLLGGMAQVRDLDAAVSALVRERLWEEVEGGYQIHDYLEYNLPAEEIRRRRAEKKRRQGEWRERHRNARGRFVEEVRAETGVSSHHAMETTSIQELGVTGNRPTPPPTPPPLPNPIPMESCDSTPASDDAGGAVQAPPPTAKGRRARLPDTPAVAFLTGVGKVRLKDIAKAAIDETVTAQIGPDLERWKAVVKAWINRGYRATNVEGMLSWYRDGIPEQGPPRGNAGARASPTEPAAWKVLRPMLEREERSGDQSGRGADTG